MEAQQAQQTPGISGIDNGQHRDRSFAVGLDQIGHGEGELAPQVTGRVVDGEVLRRNAGSLQPDRQQGIADGHSRGGGKVAAILLATMPLVPTPLTTNFTGGRRSS
jgi:hypothetical protein